MHRSDWKPILIIGAGVGLLIQPILANNLPAGYSLSVGLRLGIFLGFLIFAPFALFVARVLSRWWSALYQFARFAAVGTLNSFIDIGVFNLETFLYGTAFVSNSVFAVLKAISFLFATTNSFIWNKRWTFSAREKTNAGQVTSFYGIALVGWAINVGVATFVKASGPVGSRVWVNLVAPLAGIAASFVWNFLGYKYFVFKKPAVS